MLSLDVHVHRWGFLAAEVSGVRLETRKQPLGKVKLNSQVFFMHPTTPHPQPSTPPTWSELAPVDSPQNEAEPWRLCVV